MKNSLYKWSITLILHITSVLVCIKNVFKLISVRLYFNFIPITITMKIFSDATEKESIPLSTNGHRIPEWIQQCNSCCKQVDPWRTWCCCQLTFPGTQIIFRIADLEFSSLSLLNPNPSISVYSFRFWHLSYSILPSVNICIL